MSQSCACSLFFTKTNEKDACSRVPQSSSLPQSCAKEKSSGVEIFSKGEGMTVLYVYSANNSACALTFCILALRILPKRTLLLSDSRTRRDWEDKFPFYINKRNTNSRNLDSDLRFFHNSKATYIAPFSVLHLTSWQLRLWQLKYVCIWSLYHSVNVQLIFNNKRRTVDLKKPFN